MSYNEKVAENSCRQDEYRRGVEKYPYLSAILLRPSTGKQW